VKVYGKLSGHDFWISLATVSTVEQGQALKGKWDLLCCGPLPAGEQTIGQKLGYAT
jgi:hypothetical protein